MSRLRISLALAELKKPGPPIRTMFEHGNLKIEFYKPPGEDPQPPHEKDELYFIASGSGKFINNGVEQEVETGEVIFVPAGSNHRFFEFTNDFSTWVIFYGPIGGDIKLMD